MLPPVPGSSITDLAVQVGKDGVMRLLNLRDLSGQGAVGLTGGEIGGPFGPALGGGVLTAPAVWQNTADNSIWVFVSHYAGFNTFQVTVVNGGQPALQPIWSNGTPGSSPLVANNVVYAASSGIIQALDPTTGTQLWQSTGIAGIHWESPVVANGVLYITDEISELTAYSLPSSPLAPTATPTPLFLPYQIFIAAIWNDDPANDTVNRVRSRPILRSTPRPVRPRPTVSAIRRTPTPIHRSPTPVKRTPTPTVTSRPR